MTGLCDTGVCDYDYFASSYPDPFENKLLLYCGSEDDLGFAENYRTFSQYLNDTSQPYELYLTETSGHKQDGHSVRYYRFIMAELLEEVSAFYYPWAACKPLFRL